jgi:hypothetical protein
MGDAKIPFNEAVVRAVAAVIAAGIIIAALFRVRPILILPFAGIDWVVVIVAVFLDWRRKKTKGSSGSD